MKLKTKVVKLLPNGNFQSHHRLSRQRVHVLSRIEKPVIILIALFCFILTSFKPCFKLVVLKQLFVKSSDLGRRMRARAPCLQSNRWSYYAGFSSSESSKAKKKKNEAKLFFDIKAAQTQKHRDHRISRLTVVLGTKFTYTQVKITVSKSRLSSGVKGSLLMNLPWKEAT